MTVTLTSVGCSRQNMIREYSADEVSTLASCNDCFEQLIQPNGSTINRLPSIWLERERRNIL